MFGAIVFRGSNLYCSPCYLTIISWERFETDGQVLSWLESYLTDKHQKVVITDPVQGHVTLVQSHFPMEHHWEVSLFLSYAPCIQHPWVTYAANTVLTSKCMWMTSNFTSHLSQGHCATDLTELISHNCALQKSGHGLKITWSNLIMIRLSYDYWHRTTT